MTRPEQRLEAHSTTALRILLITIAMGLICIVIYALQASNIHSFFSITSVGIMVAGAALFVGGVLGFLFGIPRTLQDESSIPGPSNGNKSDSTTVDYRVNTNLEQISDWLTKMLVGVGLTQLTALPSYFQRITSVITPGLGGNASSSVFALSVLIFFAVVGFLFGYLWTRLNLAGLYRQADLMAIGQLENRVVQTDRKFEEFRKQSEDDSNALNLVYKQLNPDPDELDVTQDELNAAVTSAFRTTRVQIFNQANRVRSDNWRDNKEIMERTIPIFRALIYNDKEGRYHRNYGQLGYALKDQREPDWVEAEKSLTTAISIRGPWQEQGWLFYEFNRALCRIVLDENFTRNEPSQASRKEAIISDLGAAWHIKKRFIRNEQLVQDWMSLNDIKESMLSENN